MFESILGAPGWLSWLSVRLLISAQVRISWFMGWSPVSGSVLTVQSPLGILSLPLSLLFPCVHGHVHTLSLSINKKKKKRKKKTSLYFGFLKPSKDGEQNRYTRGDDQSAEKQTCRIHQEGGIARQKRQKPLGRFRHVEGHYRSCHMCWDVQAGRQDSGRAPSSVFHN